MIRLGTFGSHLIKAEVVTATVKVAIKWNSLGAPLRPKRDRTKNVTINLEDPVILRMIA